ncbi:hypothetical protein [Amycolatopsis saalfeldensis]|uniref:Lipoprotein n=1 Tax=Amycolatopsis saalfeldensis TaxID=394193 RepID=A0A1H8R3B8_9PSEU|nr:hypothetical protein [Amycolatopsis saalfeldensis]SEO60777.1 hypothetical protein SAMN04489732_101598 [Amycolatopsis saalfeldensis]
MSTRALPLYVTGFALLVAGCSGGGIPSAAPTSSAATPPAATTSAALPSTSTQATSSTKKPAAGAVERYETFLHAVGNQDVTTACEIAGPAAKKAEDEGIGPCETTFPMTFAMISPAQRKALQSATVDRARITETSTKVDIPAKAVKAAVKFTDSDLGDAVLELRNGTWYVTD